MGIPSDIAVRLSINAVTFTIPDAVFQTVAGPLFTLLSCSVNRSAVTSESKAFKVDQPCFGRMVQEKGAEDFKEPGTCVHVSWRLLFEFFKEVFDGDLFDRRSFFFFALWLFGFFFGRANGICKVIFVAAPKTREKVVKRSDAWCVANTKTAKESMKMVFLHVGNPRSYRRNLELNRKHNRTQHVRRKARSRAKVRITILHNLINR